MKRVTLISFFVFLLFIGCDSKPINTVSPSEKNISKRILIIIAPEHFRDEELFVPKKMFEENGHLISIASTVTGTAKGMLGGIVQSDLTITNAKTEDYDVFVIVGGTGAEKYLWDSVQLRNLVQDARRQNKIIGAICLSPVVLARAGILKDIKATVYPDDNAISEMKQNNADYKDKSVIISGNIVTARDPKSAEEFARSIIGLLKSSR